MDPIIIVLALAALVIIVATVLAWRGHISWGWVVGLVGAAFGTAAISRNVRRGTLRGGDHYAPPPNPPTPPDLPTAARDLIEAEADQALAEIDKAASGSDPAGDLADLVRRRRR